MRLTCPNCAAEYEVDATLIPDGGRDVQCSNCGETWFELPPTTVEEPPAPVVAAPVADGDTRAGREDEAEPSDWDDTAPEDDTPEPPPAPEPPALPETAPPSRSLSEPTTPAAPEGPTRREVDPRALDILKEEADRELANRRRDREAVEVQSEFDLTAKETEGEPSRALRARMARLRGESEPRPQSRVSRQSRGGGYAPPERELLPDIDEINSSLRPPNADAEDADAARRTDFRRGFGVMVGLSVFLVAIYITAPAIARTLPGLQPLMVSYVDAANGFRDYVDGLLR